MEDRVGGLVQERWCLICNFSLLNFSAAVSEDLCAGAFVTAPALLAFVLPSKRDEVSLSRSVWPSNFCHASRPCCFIVSHVFYWIPTGKGAHWMDEVRKDAEGNPDPFEATLAITYQYHRPAVSILSACFKAVKCTSSTIFKLEHPSCQSSLEEKCDAPELTRLIRQFEAYTRKQDAVSSLEKASLP